MQNPHSQSSPPHGESIAEVATRKRVMTDGASKTCHSELAKNLWLSAFLLMRNVRSRSEISDSWQALNEPPRKAVRTAAGLVVVGQPPRLPWQAERLPY